jgi:hypothetical protein
MAKVHTLLLATAAMVAANSAGAADLVRPAAYRHHVWRSSHRCTFVQGVRGGTPLSVPFFSDGWSPGPTYEAGWRHCTCCAAVAPVISVKY